MPFRHVAFVLALFLALLPTGSAFAASDGDLCRDPLSFLVCMGAAAVAAPLDAAQNFWWNRAREALEADRMDDAVHVARTHPDQARVDDLLRFQVSRVLATVADPGLQARRTESLDRLVAARPAAWGATSATQEMLVQVAQSRAPDADALLKRLLDDGLTAPDVYRYYLGYQKVCPEATLPCPRLVLLLDHGLSASPTGLAALLADTARSGRWDDADHLLERGADPNVEGIRTGIAATTLAAMCPSDRDATRRQRCTARRDQAMRYLFAHGADPDGRPTAARRCVTPLDIAVDANDPPLIALLQSAGADATASARCRAAAGIAPPAPGVLSRH